jgi:tRNA A37 methylthiotransferase MiaB
MPIQHITDNMLKIMKRGSSVNKLKELLNLMKEEFSFVRTSVIIGHPGETQEDFEILKNFLKEYKFDRVNVFAYSDEEGTSAYNRKDKIEPEIIEKRIKEIQKVIDKATRERQKLYLDKKIECFMDGLTDDGLFYSVRPKLWTPEVDGDILINESEIEELEIGEVYTVIPNQLAKEQLIGKIIK